MSYGYIYEWQLRRDVLHVRSIYLRQLLLQGCFLLKKLVVVTDTQYGWLMRCCCVSACAVSVTIFNQ